MRATLVAFAAAVVLCACAARSPGGSAPAALPSPSASVLALQDQGRALFTKTQALMPHNVGAAMACSACHLAAGTKARGGSLVGIYARFPQWNKRAHRVIMLQDRVAECFLYSMNGTPPAYGSRDMEAMVAYIASLSRGTRVGATPDPQLSYAIAPPPHLPSVSRGAAIYAQKCSACHQANGNGIAGTFPPLWGPHSFNSGAGMHRVATMAGFVRYNMPANAPGTLSPQQAYDVAQYVLSHTRPQFKRTRAIAYPPVKAEFF